MPAFFEFFNLFFLRGVCDANSGLLQGPRWRFAALNLSYNLIECYMHGGEEDPGRAKVPMSCVIRSTQKLVEIHNTYGS